MLEIFFSWNISNIPQLKQLKSISLLNFCWIFYTLIDLKPPPCLFTSFLLFVRFLTNSPELQFFSSLKKSSIFLLYCSKYFAQFTRFWPNYSLKCLYRLLFSINAKSSIILARNVRKQLHRAMSYNLCKIQSCHNVLMQGLAMRYVFKTHPCIS